MKKVAVVRPFGKGFRVNNNMRPMCSACNQRFCAVNYIKEDVTHYRSRCEPCIKKNRKIKAPVPRWQHSGYKKKPACDLCGFRAKFLSQLLVYHIDGNLHNADISNLRTICLNCVEQVKRQNVTWRRGDLEPDT
jgi:hypothetical protein